MLVRGLAEEGFAVTRSRAAPTCSTRSNGGSPDALVIDIGLPDTDGRDLCQALRARGIQTPVLFLTARTPSSTGLQASTPAATTT